MRIAHLNPNSTWNSRKSREIKLECGGWSQPTGNIPRLKLAII
jgi:hypothetical protein